MLPWYHAAPCRRCFSDFILWTNSLFKFSVLERLIWFRPILFHRATHHKVHRPRCVLGSESCWRNSPSCFEETGGSSLMGKLTNSGYDYAPIWTLGENALGRLFWQISSTPGAQIVNYVLNRIGIGIGLHAASRRVRFSAPLARSRVKWHSAPTQIASASLQMHLLSRAMMG